MIRKITQRLQAKNVRNLPRHKMGFYSFIVIASASVAILAFVL